MIAPPLTKDASGETGVPSNNNKVGYWADKSGKGYHAIANRKLSSRRPTYQNTGFNSMPTIRFDGSDDVMVISGSESAFDAWDEMSVFIVFRGDNISNWRRIINKRDLTGGWYFARGTSDRAYVYIFGTSANDDRNSNHSGNWNNTQIFTLQYGKGTENGILTAWRMPHLMMWAPFSPAAIHHLPLPVESMLPVTNTVKPV